MTLHAGAALCLTASTRPSASACAAAACRPCDKTLLGTRDCYGLSLDMHMPESRGR